MQITRGKVLAQRFFDIAEEVDLRRAEALVAQLSRRPHFAGSARHIRLPNPPLEMSMGPRPTGLPDLLCTDTVCRLYDVGALVVTFVIDLPPAMEPESLIRLARRIAEAEEIMTEAALPLVEEIRRAIAPACKAGELSHQLSEEYTIFYLQATEPKCDAETLGLHLDIPRLLLGEIEPIAARERQQLVHAAFSYRPDDLVIIDWNAALVLEPAGGVDVPELLEFTSMQMLELRTYDNLVGVALDNLYEELEKEHSGFFRASRFARLSRRIMKLFVEVTEITERIDNSLTFLGDSWLARLHRAAVSEFGIPHWQRQLRNKLEMLRQINELLAEQISSQKSLNIETAIVGLIVIEVVIALIGHL
jgi:hypothetical protein